MVVEFPTNTALLRLFEMELPSEYPVTASPPFADGGRDFNLDATVKIRRWRIRYAVLTLAQAATLDAHVEAARYNNSTGSALSFDFTPRGGGGLNQRQVCAERLREASTQQRAYSIKRSIVD